MIKLSLKVREQLRKARSLLDTFEVYVYPNGAVHTRSTTPLKPSRLDPQYLLGCYTPKVTIKDLEDDVRFALESL